MHYILFYDYVSDVADRRPPHRPSHLDLIKQWVQAGKLLMAGAFEPLDGAALIFRVDSPSEIESFIASDPYVANGLVTSHRIRQWNVVTPTPGS